MKYIKTILIIVFAVPMIISCSDLKFGDAGLSEAPETSGATIDSLFSSLTDADKVLVAAYSYLPYGIPTNADNKMGGNCLESITDLQHSACNYMSDGPRTLYYNGALNASLSSQQAGNEAYRFGSENSYRAIRYGWLFIENAYKIPDATEAEVNQKIAEAKMCIAIAYSDMLRYIGGVPILDHAIDVNEKMEFPRNTFAETVEFIVRMCDEAKDYLPWKVDPVDDGRMTKAGALALKLRVLCFAASPTFNSDEPFHPDANEFHCYMNYDASRWQRAKEAADEFMRELDRGGFYNLVQPTEATHEARRLAYRSGYYDRGTVESVISVRKGYDVSVHGTWNNASNRMNRGATLNWVNMFPWEDGTDFPENFDWSNPERQPFFEPDGTGTPPGIPTRDPRLYENIAVPGDIYWDGTVAPLHTNHQNYFPNGSGFRAMKFTLQNSSDRSGKPVHFPFLRFAEVLLNTAEAYNEADGGPSLYAYECVNRVRARVGLSPLQEGMTKEQFRDALIKERALEFGYEEVRWFDMVRWGLKEDFTKPLYGLFSTGNTQNNPTEFTFEVYKLAARAWESSNPSGFDTKWYLAPIPRTELDKNYGMTQNPGW